MSTEKQTPEVVVEETTQEETALAELTKKVKELQSDLDNKTKEFERDKKDLVKQILDGGKVVETALDRDALEVEKKTLVTKLRNADALSNLKVWETSLRLRDVNLALTGKDDYQSSSATRPTHGQEVAEFMREMIADSKGSNATFNGLYSERVKDNPLYSALADAYSK